MGFLDKVDVTAEFCLYFCFVFKCLVVTRLSQFLIWMNEGEYICFK